MTIENDKTSYMWELVSVTTTFSGAKIHSKDDFTRDDSQRRFLAQHSVATLLRRCFEWLQHQQVAISSIATLCSVKNSICESSRVTSPYNDDGYYVFPPKSCWLTHVHSIVLRKSLPRWKGLYYLLIRESSQTTLQWVKTKLLCFPFCWQERYSAEFWRYNIVRHVQGVPPNSFSRSGVASNSFSYPDVPAAWHCIHVVRPSF